MEVADILSLTESGHLEVVEGINPATAELLADGVICIDGLCALRIFRTSRALSREFDVELEDETGAAFATLCFTKGLGVDDPNSLTAWRYVSFLFECSVDDIGSYGSYKFASDYVVVDRERLAEYLEHYISGSPIWGGFSHDEFELSAWEQPSAAIRARRGVSPPTAHHQEAFQRFLNANNSLDRFLRLYHTLELLFDYVTFKKVQKLGDDLVGYGAIVRDQSRSELERLTSILAEFCRSRDDVGARLNAAAPYEATCRSVFQEYSKDSNPLKDSRFDSFWGLVAGAGVSLVNLTGANLANSGTAPQMMVKVAAYWIYRVRCSIAHNRVGEFILTDEHDSFVAEFAIPLLSELVEQILSNPDFKALTD